MDLDGVAAALNTRTTAWQAAGVRWTVERVGEGKPAVVLRIDAPTALAQFTVWGSGRPTSRAFLVRPRPLPSTPECKPGSGRRRPFLLVGNWHLITVVAIGTSPRGGPQRSTIAA